MILVVIDYVITLNYPDRNFPFYNRVLDDFRLNFQLGSS